MLVRKDFVYQIIAKLINVKIDAYRNGFEKSTQTYWSTYITRGIKPRVINAAKVAPAIYNLYFFEICISFAPDDKYAQTDIANQSANKFANQRMRITLESRLAPILPETIANVVTEPSIHQYVSSGRYFLKNCFPML